MITKLTKEQEAKLAIYRDKWTAIGLDCTPFEKGRAEAAVREAYRCAGLKEPRIFIHLDSPLRGAVGAAFVQNLPDSVRDSVGASVWASVWASVGDSVRASVWDSVWDSVRASVRASVGASVRASVGDSVRRACYGQHDANWLGFYDFFREVCDLAVCDKLIGLMAVARECGWWWPFADAVIITPKAKQLHRDERGRLHCENGPAIIYPDGWGFWAIHGVRVPQHVVETPGKISVAEIEKENNAEIRRVMIDRYGQARYLVDSGAKQIHADDYGVLYRKEIPGDEPLVMVKVVNSTAEPDGSFKDYFLRVPPTVTTAREAVAWTFEQEETEYENAIET